MKTTIDMESWENDRVPKDVLFACLYIMHHQAVHGTGPTWDSIGIVMGWKCSREEMRKKMKRLRRWGVCWKLNVAGSTSVHPSVREHVKRLGDNTYCLV